MMAFTHLIFIIACIIMVATSYSISWWDYEPYTKTIFGEQNSSDSWNITGVFIEAMRDMSINCLDIYLNDLKQDFHASHALELNQVSPNSTFLLPITRSNVISYGMSTRSMGQTHFLPVIESQGILLIAGKLNHNNFFLTVELTWPLLVLILTSSGFAGIIIWALERCGNTGEFPSPFHKGLGEGIWWAVVTMTTVGYGDRKPLSMLGRIFAIIWILVGMTMISLFTASLTTTFNIDQDMQKEIRGVKVGVLSGTREYEVGFGLGAVIYVYNSTEELIDAIDVNEVQAGLIDSIHSIHYEYDFKRRGFQILNLIRHQAAFGMTVNGIDEPTFMCLQDIAWRRKQLYLDRMCSSIQRPEVGWSSQKARENQSILGGNLLVLYIAPSILAFTILLILSTERCRHEA